MKGKEKQYRAISSAIKGNITGAEIGAHAGDMSRALFRLTPWLRLIMVDRWEPYPESERDRLPLSDIAQITDPAEWDMIKAKAQMVADSYNGHIIQAPAIEAAGQVRDDSLDFVFFDASRDFETAKKEIEAWLPKIKSGGLIMGYHTKRFPYSGLMQAAGEFGNLTICDQLFWMVRVNESLPI